MVNLYELSVENYLRVLSATIAFMKKSELHFAEHEKDANEIIKMRLAPDMLPFFFQINSVRHHSLHATQALFNNIFLPPNRNYKQFENSKSDIYFLLRIVLLRHLIIQDFCVCKENHQWTACFKQAVRNCAREGLPRCW